MKRNNKIIWGSALVVCGIIWLVCICLHINILFNGWWTLFIIVPCICALIGNNDKTGPAIGLGVGVLLLLAEQNVIDWDMFWKIGLAVLVIALGLGMIFGNRRKDADLPPVKTLSRDGKNIRVVDLSKIDDTICNYLVICEGNTPTQVHAIAESVGDMMREKRDTRPITVDGQRNSLWIAMDYADIVVHVFVPEYRQFYDIDNLWEDADLTDIPDLD